jgi:CRP-like cAMP-binding protein
MEFDKEKQARAMAKARQSLLQAEIKREEARMNQSTALFLQGQHDVLLNDEFVENLAAHILKLYRGDQRKKAITLLDKLEQSICNPSPSIRERSLIVLMILSEHAYQNNIRELSSIIARISANWLSFEKEFSAGFEPVCLKLQQLIIEMLISEQWYEVEELIVTMARISDKTLQKNNLIQGIVARVHDHLADPDVLEILTAAYLKESNQRKDVVENILINMGRQGSRFLVQRLAYSNDKEERLALIDLIPRIGAIGIPVLTEYLEDPRQPWYVVRNIIMIIARLGDDRLYNNIEPHLAHEDIRVQQQVLNCIEVLGGDSMKKRLLDALQAIGDDLKPHLVDLLVQYKDPDIEAALLDLFEQRESFSSHVHDFLVAKLCRKMALYPSAETIQALLNLIEERKQRYGEGDGLVKAALITLHQIEQDTSAEAAPVPDAEKDQGNRLIENEVLARLSTENEDDGNHTGGGLSDIFVETLTDTLNNRKQADPDQEVAATFEPHQSQEHHLMIWSAFYEELETSEANSFFAALRPMKLDAGELIAQQGDVLTDLIFIDHGYADINRSNDGAQRLFAPLQAGDVIGSESFFDDLPWDLNVVAQTEIQVRLLSKRQFKIFSADLPGISAQLESFCRSSDILPALVRQAAKEAALVDKGAPEIQAATVVTAAGDATIEAETTAYMAHPGSGGFNIVLSHTDIENLRGVLGHQASVELAFANGSTSTCFAFIAGGGYYAEPADRLFMHVRLYHPIEEENYTCNSIHLM